MRRTLQRMNDRRYVVCAWHPVRALKGEDRNPLGLTDVRNDALHRIGQDHVALVGRREVATVAVLARRRVNLHRAHRLIWHIVVTDDIALPRAHRRRVETVVRRWRRLKDHDGLHTLRAEGECIGTAHHGELGREGGIGGRGKHS